jgi:hypothetical protein
MDIVERLQERLEEELGYDLDLEMVRKLEGMLSDPDVRLAGVVGVVLNCERKAG